MFLAFKEMLEILTLCFIFLSIIRPSMGTAGAFCFHVPHQEYFKKTRFIYIDDLTISNTRFNLQVVNKC